ncbi:hypothetical protein HB852_07730 [Listeria grandensis]|uniref:hypothetical protein n=1 Tax=Listeria grandensis TaxID=1494963 RepID=UPI00162A349C|nr:hypothetical protein [Listeria grandensis]MBC1474505.1 hypothetical protein [Listeria grandensis]
MSLNNYFKVLCMKVSYPMYSVVATLCYLGTLGMMLAYREFVAEGAITNGEILFLELQDVIYISFLFIPFLLFLFVIANSGDSKIFVFLFGDMKKYFQYKMMHVGLVSAYVAVLSALCGFIVLKSAWEYQILFVTILFLLSFQILVLFLLLKSFMNSNVLSVLIIIGLSFVEDQLNVYKNAAFYFYKVWFTPGHPIYVGDIVGHVFFLIGCILVTSVILYVQFVNKRVIQYEK